VLMLLELDKEDDIMLFLLMRARALRGGAQCWAALLELDVRAVHWIGVSLEGWSSDETEKMEILVSYNLLTENNQSRVVGGDLWEEVNPMAA
jgi:hypothetical protein